MGCLVPLPIKNKKTGEMVTVPCSKCVECRKRFVSAWSFRLMQEDKVSSSAYFITLTYDNNTVPLTNKTYMGLRPVDLQLYFKKLRKRHGLDYPRCLKYYAVGEYGGKSFRPHYHIILFNAELKHIVGEKNALMLLNKKIAFDGKHNFQTSCWDKGHLTIGRVSEASVGYTLKYITKPHRIPQHKNDDRIPEFARMSKGLGLGYLTKAMVAWHKNDLENRMYCNIQDGKKVAMPRYYKDKIYNDFERCIAGEASRIKLLNQQTADYSKYGSDYYVKRSESHFAQQDKHRRDGNKKSII